MANVNSRKRIHFDVSEQGNNPKRNKFDGSSNPAISLVITKDRMTADTGQVLKSGGCN